MPQAARRRDGSRSRLSRTAILLAAAIAALLAAVTAAAAAPVCSTLVCALPSLDLAHIYGLVDAADLMAPTLGSRPH